MVESQLIVSAAAGDSEAFSVLYKRYQPIVFKMQTKYFLQHLEKEDWNQEGQLIFFLCLKDFDAARSVTLGYYFKFRFEYHIISLLRRQSAEKRRADALVSSYEGLLESQGELFLPGALTLRPLSAAFGYVFVRDLLRDFHAYLSPLEKKVYLLTLAGATLPEISHAIQENLAKTSNARDRVKAKFRRWLD